MSERPDTQIPADDPMAVQLWLAVRSGAVETVERLVAEVPGLARARLIARDGGARTPLHMVADWPGFFPNGPEVVRLLIASGADPNARTTSHKTEARKGQETPLHWAASSDDADVAAALIVGGADVNAPDGSIGTPLANAVGYACWHVARLLIAHGARIDEPWQAAAMGLGDRLAELLGYRPQPDGVSKAFWHACAAGQRRTAEYLLGRGADFNWQPDYAEGTPLDAASGVGTQRENVISWLRDLGARSARHEA